MKEAREFERLLTAMVSPFTTDDRIDVDATARLARRISSTGSGIVVAGTTAESPNLNIMERGLLLQTVLRETDGRVKVIAGTGTYSTRESIELSRQAQNEDADALLLVTPYYNKPPQEGMYRHFAAIAEAVQIPVILYDVQSRTNVRLEAETVLRLDHDFENIIGLKEAIAITDKQGRPIEEARRHVGLIIEGKSEGFEVWSGDDSETIPMMEMGAYGVISVASQLVGDLIQRMINHQIIGETEQAEQLHNYLMPLFEALFPPTAPCSSPASIKAALNLTGMNVGSLRLPLVDVPDSYRDRLQVLLASYNLIPKGGETA